MGPDRMRIVEAFQARTIGGLFGGGGGQGDGQRQGGEDLTHGDVLATAEGLQASGVGAELR